MIKSLLLLLLLVPSYSFANETKHIINVARLEDGDRQHHDYKVIKIVRNWAVVVYLLKGTSQTDSPGLVFHQNTFGKWNDTGATTNICCEEDLKNHKWLIKNGYCIPIKELF